MTGGVSECTRRLASAVRLKAAEGRFSQPTFGQSPFAAVAESAQLREQQQHLLQQQQQQQKEQQKEQQQRRAVVDWSTHAALPLIVTGYVQALFNLVVVVGVLFGMYWFACAIQQDIEIKAEGFSARGGQRDAVLCEGVSRQPMRARRANSSHAEDVRDVEKLHVARSAGGFSRDASRLTRWQRFSTPSLSPSATRQ